MDPKEASSQTMQHEAALVGMKAKDLRDPETSFGTTCAPSSSAAFSSQTSFGTTFGSFHDHLNPSSDGWSGEVADCDEEITDHKGEVFSEALPRRSSVRMREVPAKWMQVPAPWLTNTEQGEAPPVQKGPESQSASADTCGLAVHQRGGRSARPPIHRSSLTLRKLPKMRPQRPEPSPPPVVERCDVGPSQTGTSAQDELESRGQRVDKATQTIFVAGEAFAESMQQAAHLQPSQDERDDVGPSQKSSDLPVGLSERASLAAQFEIASSGGRLQKATYQSSPTTSNVLTKRMQQPAHLQPPYNEQGEDPPLQKGPESQSAAGDSRGLAAHHELESRGQRSDQAITHRSSLTLRKLPKTQPQRPVPSQPALVERGDVGLSQKGPLPRHAAFESHLLAMRQDGYRLAEQRTFLDLVYRETQMMEELGRSRSRADSAPPTCHYTTRKGPVEAWALQERDGPVTNGLRCPCADHTAGTERMDAAKFVQSGTAEDARVPPDVSSTSATTINRDRLSAHELGDCVPCNWNRRKKGCKLGDACGFCHLEHPKSRKNGEEHSSGAAARNALKVAQEAASTAKPMRQQKRHKKKGDLIAIHIEGQKWFVPRM